MTESILKKVGGVHLDMEIINAAHKESGEHLQRLIALMGNEDLIPELAAVTMENQFREAVMDDQKKTIQGLQDDLKAMTEDRDNWKETASKHQ